MESVLNEYKSSLADLTFNSKPLINMLTVLAEENYSYAVDLVKIIESQVFQSPPNQRLPVLYLIDSIVKTYGPYVKLFSPNLIKTFLFVFEKAETKVRHDLYKLRTTWNGMFSKPLLHDLDVAVKQCDPNWPVKKSSKTSKREKSRKSSHPSGLTVKERVAAMMSHPEPEGRFSSDEDEYNASYQEDNDANSPIATGDILVEEEEILVDEEEKSDELEALEKELRRRKEELDNLEKTNNEKPTTSGLTEQEPANISPPRASSPAMQVPYFIDASGAKSSPISSPEPVAEPVEMETEKVQDNKRTPIEEDEQFRIGPSKNSTPDDLLYIAEKRNFHTQTEDISTKDSESQIVVNMQDQTTQYRYRKKTKNFLSQYRVPSKSVATYFRIKTKEAQTQYSPPSDRDTQADSTSSHPDGGNGIFSSKEKSALKEYVAALKDDFLPREYSKHSGLVLKNLCSQRRQGILCDITLGAEGRVFKAHKSLLASASDFFYTLFAHEEIEKMQLSHIELQGITAKALNLVLDYIYTSVLPMDSLLTIEEIITAAKRLQIHSLVVTCPALEQAVAKKIDMAGWLISSSSLLSPSNKHPYVEALRSLRDLGKSASFLAADANKYNRDSIHAGGDGSAGDFICHVDRDNSSKKRTADMTGYEPHSTEEVKYKKRKLKHYEDKSETESDFEVDRDSARFNQSSKKEDKFDSGVVASPGMPPSSWADMYSPVKDKKKKKKSSDTPSAPREQAVYKCNNCSRHIISRRNYIAHCDAHLRKGEKPYGCVICKKMFWKEVVLESHLVKIHTDLTAEQVEQLTKSKVSSPDAEEVLRKREQLSPSSAKLKQGGLWKCPECKTILQNDAAYVRHMKIRHRDGYRFKCKYCVQYFKTGASRGVHMKKHKKDGDAPRRSKKRKHSEEMYSEDELSSDEHRDDMSPEEHEKIVKNNGSSNPIESQDSESAIKLKLYHCEICGEMFSIQCFYKAHVAGHKKDLEEY